MPLLRKTGCFVGFALALLAPMTVLAPLVPPVLIEMPEVYPDAEVWAPPADTERAGASSGTRTGVERP